MIYFSPKFYAYGRVAHEVIKWSDKITLFCYKFKEEILTAGYARSALHKLVIAILHSQSANLV